MSFQDLGLKLQEVNKKVTVWECVKCSISFEEIIISPAPNVSICPICKSQEWRITDKIVKVKKLVPV